MNPNGERRSFTCAYCKEHKSYHTDNDPRLSSEIHEDYRMINSKEEELDFCSEDCVKGWDEECGWEYVEEMMVGKDLEEIFEELLS